MSKFIQVGITALRDPATGDFLPAVPLYIEETPDAKESEVAMIRDISKDFAEKMKRYMEGGKPKDADPHDKQAGVRGDRVH